MSDERKIISLKTRAPADLSDILSSNEETHVDQDTVKMLENMLALAERGRLSGCLVIAWDREAKSFCSDFISPEDDFPDLSAMKFIGYIHLVEQMLLGIAHEEFVEDM